MAGLYLGVGLMVAGGVGLLIGFYRAKPSASSGSVSVGRDNRGTIYNTNIGTPTPSSHSNHNVLTYISILVEIVGIAVTIWHATHLVAK